MVKKIRKNRIKFAKNMKKNSRERKGTQLAGCKKKSKKNIKFSKNYCRIQGREGQEIPRVRGAIKTKKKITLNREKLNFYEKLLKNLGDMGRNYGLDANKNHIKFKFKKNFWKFQVREAGMPLGVKNEIKFTKNYWKIQGRELYGNFGPFY